MLRAPLMIGIAVIVATARACAANPPATLPTDAAEQARQLAAEFQPRLLHARYMESSDVQDVHIAGWENFPTRRYRYSVTDKDGTVKSADVVMLNPSAQQIARWIVQALIEVNGTYTAADGRRAFKNVIEQSAGQFPVAGVVYEDILPADGKFEIYCFRDGVTVMVDDVPHRGTDPMTASQVEQSISGKVTRVFTYARIQSTTPQQFIDAGGSPEILKDNKPTARWMDEIRRAYQAAWGSDRNALMVAWVKGNPK